MERVQSGAELWFYEMRHRLVGIRGLPMVFDQDTLFLEAKSGSEQADRMRK